MKSSARSAQKQDGQSCLQIDILAICSEWRQIDLFLDTLTVVAIDLVDTRSAILTGIAQTLVGVYFTFGTCESWQK